jgi:hypothetical protein
MQSFIMACITAIVIAVIGSLALDSFQEFVSVAFKTESVRV